MNGNLGRHNPKLTVAFIALFTIVGTLALLIMLVLTGIIAEPETVIEQIIRTLFNR